ncbi:MAG: cyclase/dehydrase [Solirubrobacterales bacterium]|jgi:coenzyme Q-binding protein COQ10|nr:cyclase/dehydrase [Solirubrobacterales bacterium]
MPAYASCRSTHVGADPQTCFDALTDYERIPEWQSAVRTATVLERDPDGRGRVVEYEVDARITTVRYRIELLYEAPTRIASRYLEGDFKDLSGEWRLTGVPSGGTDAALDLTIDPGRAIPRPVRTMLSNVIVRGALKDLQAYVGGRQPA